MSYYPMRRAAHLRQGLLDLVADLPEGCVVIEIGSYAGESSEIFASSSKVKRLICVDPWENDYDRTDPASYQHDMKGVEAEFDRRMKPFIDSEKAWKWKIDCEEACDLYLEDTRYWRMPIVIYLDACHTYEAVKEDLFNLKGLCLAHDVLAGHDWTHPGVQRAVLEVMGRQPDKTYIDYSWMYRIEQ